MKAKDWEKVKEIFNQAVELSPDERERFLSSFENGQTHLRREVEKLLAADENSGAQFEDFSFVSARNSKAKIGRYKILREIGAGGMGTVYLAEREDLAQKVALKIIRRGAGSDIVLRRFRKEQEILAALEHANIAHLLDVGLSDDGLPFLAMEYVEGADLLTYCAENNLSLDAKLKLFRKICDAVAYAHSRLVVHRDLKPSNILVNSKGEPKLLDFGISKLLSEENSEEKGTVTSIGMLTPNYAAPEQFRGESVSTAADVYSLSVILYELLTGKLPYDIENCRYEEAARIVCETNPQKPSDVLTQSRKAAPTGDAIRRTDKGNFFKGQRTKDKGRKSLKGDLDNILLKALRKEPERRYSSVEKFSDDLRRHLEGLPVTARPDTFAYRAEKFVKRNRISVISAALVMLAFLAGVGGITWQYFRAERERQLAQKRYTQVRDIANKVIYQYNDDIENLPGSIKVREKLVRDALQYLDALAEDTEKEPALKSELAAAYTRVGSLQYNHYANNLGDIDGAKESFDKARKLQESLLNAGDNRLKLELAGTYHYIADIAFAKNDENSSRSFYEKAQSLYEQILRDEPENEEVKLKLVNLLMKQAGNLTIDDDVEIGIYRNVIEITRQILSLSPDNQKALAAQATGYQRLGSSLGHPEMSCFGNFAEAEENFRREVAIRRSLIEKDPQNKRALNYYSVSLNLLGDVLLAQNKTAEAVESYAESQKITGKMVGDDPNDKFANAALVYILGRHGNGLSADKNFAEATRLLDAGWARCAETGIMESNDPMQINNCIKISKFRADNLKRQNKTNEALKVYQNTLDLLENKLPADFVDNEIRGEIALVNLKIGEIYYELNKSDEAVKSLEKSVALIKEIEKTDKLRFIQSRTLEESQNLLDKI